MCCWGSPGHETLQVGLSPRGRGDVLAGAAQGMGLCSPLKNPRSLWCYLVTSFLDVIQKIG